MGVQVTCLADGTLEVECDAVIVGSGAGGGVTAALLSEAGAKVGMLPHQHPYIVVCITHKAPFPWRLWWHGEVVSIVRVGCRWLCWRRGDSRRRLSCR